MKDGSDQSMDCGEELDISFDTENRNFIIHLPGHEPLVLNANSRKSQKKWAQATGHFVGQLSKDIADSNRKSGIDLCKVCSYEPNGDDLILESPLYDFMDNFPNSVGEDKAKLVNVANNIVNFSSPSAPNLNLSKRSLLLKEGGLSARHHDMLTKSGLCTHRTNLNRLSVPFEVDGSWENPGKGFVYGSVVSMLMQDNLQWQYHEGKYFHTVTGCGLMLILPALEELHNQKIVEESTQNIPSRGSLPLLNDLSKEVPLDSATSKSELINTLPLLSPSNSDTM